MVSRSVHSQFPSLVLSPGPEDWLGWEERLGQLLIWVGGDGAASSAGLFGGRQAMYASGS